MTRRPDVVVAGGGVAGVMAAITARRHGLAVTLVDDNATPGGQVFREPSAFARTVTPPDHERREGDRLRELLRCSGVRVLSGWGIWSVQPGYRFDLSNDFAVQVLEAGSLVAATGAVERFFPFAGWTDPAVMGLAGASLLLRAGGVLPGRRTLVAGAGPLLFSVAHQVLDAGGEVVAIVDTATRTQWAARAATLALDPARLKTGVAWMARLARAGIPVLGGAVIRQARRGEDDLDVTIGSVRGGAPVRSVRCDAIACGYGLKPSLGLTRMLKARHVFDEAAGYWHPHADPFGRTDVAGLYVTGDGAGVRGAQMARLRGILTGHGLAFDHGRIDAATLAHLARPLLRAMRRLEVVSRAMTSLMNPRPAIMKEAEMHAPDTLMCRCERVSIAAGRQAIRDGAGDMNQFKAWTRCGMGPCQGRMCEDSARQLLARHTARAPAEVGAFTQRLPLRPVPVRALSGNFAYADIVLPQAAPP